MAREAAMGIASLGGAEVVIATAVAAHIAMIGMAGTGGAPGSTKASPGGKMHCYTSAFF